MKTPSAQGHRLSSALQPGQWLKMPGMAKEEGKSDNDAGDGNTTEEGKRSKNAASEVKSVLLQYT